MRSALRKWLSLVPVFFIPGAAVATTAQNGYWLNTSLENGYWLNGTQLNGYWLNSSNLGGGQVNGLTLKGLTKDGMEILYPRLEGSELVGFTTCDRPQSQSPCIRWQKQSLHMHRGAWFVGATIQATVGPYNRAETPMCGRVYVDIEPDTRRSTRPATLKILAFQMVDGVASYQIVLDSDRANDQYICGRDQQKKAVWAVPLAGAWNPFPWQAKPLLAKGKLPNPKDPHKAPRSLTEGGGLVPASSVGPGAVALNPANTGGARLSASGEVITFACENAALGECADKLGFRPWQRRWTRVCLPTNADCRWQAQDLTAYHQACTRMIRADYCGDGRSHTISGTAIDLYDKLGLNTPLSSTLQNWQKHHPPSTPGAGILSGPASNDGHVTSTPAQRRQASIGKPPQAALTLGSNPLWEGSWDDLGIRLLDCDRWESLPFDASDDQKCPAYGRVRQICSARPLSATNGPRAPIFSMVSEFGGALLANYHAPTCDLLRLERAVDSKTPVRRLPTQPAVDKKVLEPSHNQ
jgi:hypothetical protein